MRNALLLGLAVAGLVLALGLVAVLASLLWERWRLARVRRELARLTADAARLSARRASGSAGPQRAQSPAAALHPVRPDHPRLVRQQRHGDSRQGAEVKR